MFLKFVLAFTVGVLLGIGIFGCNAQSLPTQQQSAAAVSPTEIPRAPVIVHTPPRPRPTPRAAPPRGLHTRRTTGGWIVLEPNE
jgi:hypothetical protein